MCMLIARIANINFATLHKITKRKGRKQTNITSYQVTFSNKYIPVYVCAEQSKCSDSELEAMSSIH